MSEIETTEPAVDASAVTRSGGTPSETARLEEAMLKAAEGMEFGSDVGQEETAEVEETAEEKVEAKASEDETAEEEDQLLDDKGQPVKNPKAWIASQRAAIQRREQKAKQAEARVEQSRKEVAGVKERERVLNGIFEHAKTDPWGAVKNFMEVTGLTKADLDRGIEGRREVDPEVRATRQEIEQLRSELATKDRLERERREQRAHIEQMTQVQSEIVSVVKAAPVDKYAFVRDSYNGGRGASELVDDIQAIVRETKGCDPKGREWTYESVLDHIEGELEAQAEAALSRNPKLKNRLQQPSKQGARPAAPRTLSNSMSAAPGGGKKGPMTLEEKMLAVVDTMDIGGPRG